MNREIEFKAKRKDNGKWVCGDLLHNVDCIKIREKETDIHSVAKSYIVVPKTVGQFTGLKDKNGKEIYEGDIVRTERVAVVPCDYVTQKETIRKNKSWKTIRWYEIEVVEWSKKEYAFKFRAINSDFGITHIDGNHEIIGNIHDNPELLEETK